MVIAAIGYGAGDDRPGPVPNALRVIIGERAAGQAPGSRPAADRVVVLETNIDDMSPEWLGHLMERLFAAGALDVTFAPILMKKSRPAQEVKVIGPLHAEDALARTLFAESTTFGLRRLEMERIVLERESTAVDTPWGRVRVKVGRLGGGAVTASPEFEDLRAAAQAGGVPLKEVHEQVLRAFRSRPG
jgi:uncharacterized protein (DUF111 family)